MLVAARAARRDLAVDPGANNIIKAQLPFVAQGSVLWLEVVGTLGVWVLAELGFWGGGGQDVPSVVAPDFCCAQTFVLFLSSGGVVRTKGYFQIYL